MAFLVATRPGGAQALAPPGWLGDTPISPEATLRDAGIDDTRQAVYQRKLSALLAGGREAEG